jgi:hypothetical protein
LFGEAHRIAALATAGMQRQSETTYRTFARWLREQLGSGQMPGTRRQRT